MNKEKKSPISGESFNNGIAFNQNKTRVKVYYFDGQLITDIKQKRLNKPIAFLLTALFVWIISQVLLEKMYFLTNFGILVYLISFVMVY